MKNKSIKKSYIHFIGHSAEGVTGSAYLVNHKQYQVLLDFGMVQGEGDIYSNYKANYDLCHKIRPKLLDAIIITHENIDHFGLLPYIYSKGANCTTYVPQGIAKYIKILLEDSLKIMQSDSIKIEKKKGRKAPLLYSQQDIDKTMEHIIEIPYRYPININSDIKFEFISAGHIQHSASIILTLKRGFIVTKIYYSGDIGPDKKQLYVEERETPDCFDIGIVENTYNIESRPNNAKDREKDLEKIVSIVNEYNKVLIPAFALNRSQVILTELYNLWKQNKIPHDIKVVFDAPLGIKISKCWDGEVWEEVWNWKNLIKVEDYDSSINLTKQLKKCIVIAGAGMLNAGRILGWLKASLGDSNNHLVFIGFCPPDGLPAEIKSNQKYVNVDGETIKNNCNYTELRSFSSHACYQELLSFYSKFDCKKICLVHGDQQHKPAFANVLQDRLIEQGKSTRVICTNKDQKIYF